MNRLRKYLSPWIAGVFVFGLAASALAAAGDHSPNQNSSETAKTKVAEAQKQKEPKAEAEGDGKGSTSVNHGHCVSYWARAAKEAGLRGKTKGGFVSAVAQDEEATSAKLGGGESPTGQCESYQEDLDAAASVQSAEGGRENGGGSGKSSSAAKSGGKGKSDEHRPAGS